MEDECKTYFGKYRGTVADTKDLMGLGRVKVKVADVQGGIEKWAMPCTPYAGKGVGFFAVPPVDAHVWVEFERGDPDLPIWSGCFWYPGEPPEPIPGPQQVAKKILKTKTITLILDDMEGVGGFSLEVNTGPTKAKIEAKATNLKISWGQSSTILFDTTGVSINGTNLKILP